MDINLQTGALPPQPLPSARSADTPVVKDTDTTTTAAATPVSQTPAPAPTVPQATVAADSTNAVEEKRFQQLQQAAENFFKNVYAVSDTTFTIFKDSTGQYITRFTSLRDGTVTYIPEPKLLQYASNQSRDSLVEITA